MAARTSAKAAALLDLQRIPGVGASIAADLYALGVRRVADLKGRDPQVLYDDSCTLAGQHIDRCLLYVYRCAVYYASNTAHAPDRLKWWNWADRKMEDRLEWRSSPVRARPGMAAPGVGDGASVAPGTAMPKPAAKRRTPVRRP